MSAESVDSGKEERATDTVGCTVEDPVDVPSLPEVGKDPSGLSVDRELPLTVMKEMADDTVG